MKPFVCSIALLLLSSCTKIEDATRGVSSICPVHKVTMTKRSAEIEGRGKGYLRIAALVDLAGSFEAYQQVEAARFPFARTTAVLFDFENNKPDQIRIYVCPKCADEFGRWKKERQANQSLQPTAPSGRG